MQPGVVKPPKRAEYRKKTFFSAPAARNGYFSLVFAPAARFLIVFSLDLLARSVGRSAMPKLFGIARCVFLFLGFLSCVSLALWFCCRVFSSRPSLSPLYVLLPRFLFHLSCAWSLLRCSSCSFICGNVIFKRMIF